MGKIYGTCGHEITRMPKMPVAVKTSIQNGVHAISWQTLCEDCIAKYKVLGLLLETVKAQDEWLHGGRVNTPDRYR